jgi:phage terminase large subunit-like protein
MKELNQALKLAKLLREMDSKNAIRKFKPIQKQMDFLTSASKTKALIAANRSGKSLTESYECALHVTGLYPDDWTGIKFKCPVDIWIIGESVTRVRDTIQEKLFGRVGQYGTGMIPGNCIEEDRIVRKSGVPNAIDIAYIKHVSGGYSSIQFFSYDQGRDKFQGSSIDMAWFDEEPPNEIYNEVRMRVLDKNGHIVFTFTPVDGITELYDKLTTDPQVDRFNITWDDCPWLNKDAQARLSEGLSDAELKARREGVAIIGSSKVFQFPEEEYICEGFAPSRHWRRLGSLDVGVAHPTAAVEAVIDDESKTIYIVREYKKSGGTPVEHAAVLKKWNVEFACDPSAWNRAIATGISTAKVYQDEGLKLFKANNDVDASIHKIRAYIGQGRLWIFNSCHELIKEIRMYRTKESETGKPKILKINDDMVDALRYVIAEIDRATVSGFREQPTFTAIDWTPVSKYGY